MTSSNKADYFDEMHEWSERKLQLLQAYVDSAVKILGSINRVYYIDGKSYVLKCINVEEDDEHFANLQEETARFGKTVQNFHGRFNDNLAAILKVIGSQPSIFFLD